MKKRNNRIGECREMNCGMNATIIAWKSSKDITVMFADGRIKEHVTYGNFVNREVQHPDLCKVNSMNVEKLKLNSINRIGDRMQMNCGLYAEIVAYRGCNDIDVKFDIDGFILEKCTYSDFKNRKISHPKFNINGISYPEFVCSKFLEHFGFKKAPNGTVLDTRGLDLFNEEHGIAVEYDGEAWHTPEKDAAKDKECAEKGIKLIRIREPNCKDFDSASTIFKLEKRDDFDCLIRTLEDVLKYMNENYGTEFDASATVPVKKEIDDAWGSMHVKRIGDSQMQNCGMLATIIHITNMHHIDVQFEDGTIVRDKQYGEFHNGGIMNPNLALKVKRVGLRHEMNCGMWAEIVEYIDGKHIRVRFDDGVEVPEYRRYAHFMEGGIAHPNMKTPRRKPEKGNENN